MKIVRSDRGLLVVIDGGERLIESLTRQLHGMRVAGATLTGLGSVTDVVLGYYDLDRKAYVKHEFSERYELLGLTGNVAWSGDELVVHAHALLGARDYRVFGGHIVEATVTATAEISVTVHDVHIHRAMNEAVGLPLISAQPG